jgi:hypothetical protein
MFTRNLFVPLIVLTLLGLQPVFSARAEMLVMESNVDGFPEGTRFTEDTLPILPEGGRIKVLMLHPGAPPESKIIEGAVKGAASRSSEQPYGGMRSGPK